MAFSLEPFGRRAYLSFPGMEGHLADELSLRFGISSGADAYGSLLVPRDDVPCGAVPYWCRTAMVSPVLLRFDSIGDAASALREMQRSWAPYQFTCFRRAQLLQEKLPYVNLKPRAFPLRLPKSPIGLYTLLDGHTMLLSAETTSLFPAGTVSLVEDHENPPSRAYLKLEEALTMAQVLFGAELPGEGSRCLDAGACPGGWTWVLRSLGASVLAVDRSPLSQSLMEDPLVTFRTHDAFTLEPDDIGPFDWVLSDVICYPERLLSWVRKWVSSGMAKRMVCTIKLQGGTDWALIREFEEIPRSAVLHLNYNKHELTFIHVAD